MENLFYILKELSYVERMWLYSFLYEMVRLNKNEVKLSMPSVYYDKSMKSSLEGLVRKTVIVENDKKCTTVKNMIINLMMQELSVYVHIDIHIFEVLKQHNIIQMKYIFETKNVYERKIYFFIKTKLLQNESKFNWELDLLRGVIGCEEKYLEFRDLNKYIIEPVFDSLNLNSDLNVKYYNLQKNKRTCIYGLEVYVEEKQNKNYMFDYTYLYVAMCLNFNVEGKKLWKLYSEIPFIQSVTDDFETKVLLLKIFKLFAVDKTYGFKDVERLIEKLKDEADEQSFKTEIQNILIK